MAEVSSHLRNFAVGEVIGFIAMLDGHPKIVGPANVQVAGAAVQQVRGTRLNPLAHAIPSDLLLNGDRLIEFYRSPSAQRQLQRTFAMGVMAPDKWESREFPHAPRQNNIVDAVAERHRYGGGLVEAFCATAGAAIARGVWDGSGRRRHDFGSLERLIGEIYKDTWVPLARMAYTKARSHFALQLTLSHQDMQRMKVLEERIQVLDAQIGVFERETTVSSEVARNVWKFASEETWE
jgi:hypothetical protein